MAVLALVIAAFAGVVYGPILGLPFVGDDYVFLDHTLHARFIDLWSLRNLDFGWYRPWPREFHFWLITRLAGLQPTAFRLVGLCLWTADLLLYAAFVRRVTSTRVAVLATLGVCTQALWGTPLIWISGSQDLWMLFFALLSMICVAYGRTILALVPLSAALLCKETAGVLPLLLLGVEVLIRKQPLRVALRRTAHLWLLVVIWVFLHPALITRLTTHPAANIEFEHRPPIGVALLRTLLSVVNLDLVPRPIEVDRTFVFATLLSAAILVAGAVFVLGRRPGRTVPSPASSSPVYAFGVLWCFAGWAPLFLPSIGWHAYYGCLGSLGAWLILALWLEARPRAACALLAALCLLRAAHARTRSWDWGNEWYQRRAGSILSAIQAEMLRQHPTLPPHSRVFLGRIPNNIGLVAGQSPALRIWYRDTTLRADFYSSYGPRPDRAAGGRDFFFRFDSSRVLVEVVPGPERLPEALQQDPEWQKDHEILASMFIRSGNVVGAAGEYAKLATARSERPDYALYAGAAYEASGDMRQAEWFYRIAAVSFGDSVVRQEAAALVRALPGREAR